MRKSTIKASPPRVALLLESSTGYGRGLLKGIVRYSRLHGPWHLYIAPGHVEQALVHARSRDVDGIIGRVRTPQTASAILPKGLPLVACFMDEFPFPRDHHKFCEIRANSQAISRMAADHLLARGFSHFAFCGFEGCPWSAVREATFIKYLTANDFRCDTHRIHLDPWTRHPNWIHSVEREQPFLIKWLRSLPKPVGLMACSDTCGQKVLDACTSLGLHVPDEVAVVGVDNDELMCGVSNIPLSSVSLKLEDAGYEGARLLDGLMSRQVKRRRLIKVEPTFVVTRGSTDTVIKNDSLATKAFRFIRDHVGEPLSVSDVVDGVGVSRRTIERHFMNAMGTSLFAEITRYRLQRAKQLLLETDMPCNRVSENAGFMSLRAFNRAFRLTEGTSPNQFRQNRNVVGTPVSM